MIDASLFKQVMRRYATGVMVLTVRDGEAFYAVTVNSVTSVSLEPPLLLVCLEKNTRSHALVHNAGQFALNILSAAQAELGKAFAYDRAARSTPTQLAETFIHASGALLFTNAPGYFVCRVVAEYPGGDHTIFLAEVQDAQLHADNPEPLVYYAGEWHALKV
jgi:flavin reductase (DIM6/NTAB) family NADH-FMN oxidoreductase RutF